MISIVRVNALSEEPDAGNLLVRVCGGSSLQRWLRRVATRKIENNPPSLPLCGGKTGGVKSPMSNWFYFVSPFFGGLISFFGLFVSNYSSYIEGAMFFGLRTIAGFLGIPKKGFEAFDLHFRAGFVWFLVSS